MRQIEDRLWKIPEAENERRRGASPASEVEDLNLVLSDYYLSPALLPAKAGGEAPAFVVAMQDLVRSFFPEQISGKERRVMLELYYSLIIDSMARRPRVFSMSLTCKDAVDRAGGANALVYTLALIASALEGMDVTQALADLPAVVFPDALLMYKKPIKTERYYIYHETVAYLLNKLSARGSGDLRKAFLETFTLRLAAPLSP